MKKAFPMLPKAKAVPPKPVAKLAQPSKKFGGKTAVPAAGWPPKGTSGKF